MLRVGLTGNLGSGKSTVAALFQAHGACILSSDAIGRDLMQPGHLVFDRIVTRFGSTVLAPDGSLNRSVLARLAFAEGHAEDLNAIVHPAVIAQQADLTKEIFSRDPHAVVIVESALLFETRHAGGEWSTRFDRILLVTAPEPEKIARFVRRQHPAGLPSAQELQTLQAEAKHRLALQIPDEQKSTRADFILTNDGSLAHLEAQVDTLWPILKQMADRSPS